MTSLACLGAGRLIDQRAVGLSDAEQLRLEEHLGRCSDCAAEASLLGTLRELADEVPTMGDARRLQIVDAALAAAPSVAVGPRVASPHRRSWAAALAVAAALCIGVVASKGTWQSGAAFPETHRVETGSLQGADGVLGSGAAIPAYTTLSSDGGARLELGAAQVEMRPGSELRWAPSTRTLELRQGSLVAEVDPEAHARFLVQTPRFVVEVTGTRFWVTLGAVGVERGSVRVLSADGQVLSAKLSAGSRWHVPELAAAPLQARAPKPPVPDPPSAAPVEVAEEVEQVEVPAKSSEGPSARELLRRARSSVGEGQTAGARELARRALARHPSRPQRAEALTLLAECDLVEGKGAQAAVAYLDVAKRFAALAAGENALFAAARIHATRGERASAGALLQRYQRRYPAGRFRQEVAARLKALQAGR